MLFGAFLLAESGIKISYKKTHVWKPVFRNHTQKFGTAKNILPDRVQIFRFDLLMTRWSI